MFETDTGQFSGLLWSRDISHVCLPMKFNHPAWHSATVGQSMLRCSTVSGRNATRKSTLSHPLSLTGSMLCGVARIRLPLASDVKDVNPRRQPCPCARPSNDASMQLSSVCRPKCLRPDKPSKLAKELPCGAERASRERLTRPGDNFNADIVAQRGDRGGLRQGQRVCVPLVAFRVLLHDLGIKIWVQARVPLQVVQGGVLQLREAHCHHVEHGRLGSAVQLETPELRPDRPGKNTI